MKKTLFVLFALALVVASLAGGAAFLLRQKHLVELNRLASQAEDRLNSKSYDQAISMLRKVEADGGTDRSSYLLGRSFSQQGKNDDAKRYYNALLSKYPNSPLVPDARLALARFDIEAKKDLVSAQNQLLQILSKSPKTPAADHALVLLAEISLQKKDETQARKNLEIVLRKKNSPARGEAEFLIGDLNMKRLKSPEPAPGDEVYTIQRGDTLWVMAKKLKVPQDLLIGINDLSPKSLTVGQQIRIPRLSISLVVDKPARTVTILNNNEFLKKYKIAINQNDKVLPAGNYSVVKKEDKGIAYADPETNETIKAGAPGNPYGDKYIEMRRGTGIHGTNDPEKIGKLVSTGAILMSNQDIDEVYALVQIKTPVVVKGSVDPEKTPGI